MGTAFTQFYKNKKVLVTGGSSGIGKHIARDLLLAGAQVTIVGRDPERLREAERELSAVSPPVSSIQADIADLASVRSMVAKFMARFGTPDILINNAGFAVYRTIEESTSEEIADLIRVNLLGAMYCTREFLPAMIRRRSGHIVNISSIAGRLIITPNATYGAAKHGMVAWSRALRIELDHTGVNVNVVCPGRVETAFFDHETFQKRAARKETEYTVPIGVVSLGTLRAVAHNRFMTTIPATLGILAWLVNAFPWPFQAGMERLMRSRIRTLSAGSGQGEHGTH